MAPRGTAALTDSPSSTGGSTSRRTAGPSCWTKSSTQSCRGTPRRWSGWGAERPAVIYLTPSELLHVAERAIGDVVAVRDPGLLASEGGRPRATVFGQDASECAGEGGRPAALPGAVTRWSMATSAWPLPG